MAEVVSVSDPFPLEAFSPGLSMVAFSASAGCSGTGMTSGENKIQNTSSLDFNTGACQKTCNNPKMISL